MRGSMGAFARHRRAFHVRSQDVCRSSAGSSCAEQSERAQRQVARVVLLSSSSGRHGLEWEE